MKLICRLGLLAGLVVASVIAEAQTIQVKQVKGRRAIVEIQEGTLSPGQTLTNGGGSSSSGGSDRSNYIGLSGSLTSYKPTGSANQLTNLSGSLLYGWNKEKYEFGVLVRLGTVSGGEINTTTAGLGGKFDWNFTPHRNGATQVYGLGGELVYTTVSTNINTTTMYIFPAFSGRWFVLGNDTAIRLDAGIEQSSTSVNGVNSSEQGLKAAFALFNYF